MKFGGTSIASGKNIRHVARLIADHVSQGYRIVTVVSALEGITDKLIEVAKQARNGNSNYIHEFKQKLLKEHLVVAKEAIQKERLQQEIEQILKTLVDELEKVLIGIVYVGELTSKSKDYVLSFGERLSAPIVMGALRDLELNAKYYTGGEIGIVTDSNFGEAKPLMNVTKHQVKEKIEPLLEKNIIPIVTGYIAATQDGETTTLGRGGSDYTTTIIGSALTATEVWIWTDVDGLMTSDPKIVPTAKMLPELSFKEATEMTIFGAKAMHPRALEPAMEESIPVRIRNVFDPENSGTLIVEKQKTRIGEAVKAITLVKEVALVNVSGAGMVGSPGTAAKVFDVIGRDNINVLMISQSVSEANISFVIQRSLLEKAVSTLEIALLGRGLIREVTAEDDVCVVAVVGAGMKGTPGVASRLFTAVARKGINIRMIAQGSSELNISCVVKETDGEKAVQAIHEEFKLQN
ncbi:MAG: aspartate kinase [Candidatus Bathyarchaeota archaeon]|nr:MAG: aspartate kinase [Candidatus Bathyarchaeota archaeon]UCE58061.1 MAG: aspartate kinase [Candidatus Bathyarchaeota archaeon]